MRLAPICSDHLLRHAIPIWAVDNPASCNLVNAADLPAAPFRSDDW